MLRTRSPGHFRAGVRDGRGNRTDRRFRRAPPPDSCSSPPHRADGRDPGRQPRHDRIEEPDRHRPGIGGIPLVEDPAEELPPLSRRERERLPPPLPVEFDALDILVERDTKLPQIAVDLDRTILVGGGDQRQRVEIDPVLLQRRESAHDGGMAAAAVRSDPETVVHLLGTVDADPDQKTVLPEKLPPFAVEQSPVGLQCVGDCAAGGGRPLEPDRLAEKVDSHQGRLPSLPPEGVMLHRHGEVVPDHRLQRRPVHPVDSGAEHRLLRQVETVPAAKIAVEGGRLQQQRERILHRNSSGWRSFSSGTAQPRPVRSSRPQ